MTWLAWDGAPILGDGNAWTPLKALRRITDHLLDHLAEIEATLAGQPTVPDSWLGRTVTLDSDWARFTEGDLNEASNRLLRYAELYRVRLGGLSAAELDLPRPSAWTVRQIAHHVAGVTYYAHQVGDLTIRKLACPPAPPPSRGRRRYREGRQDEIDPPPPPPLSLPPPPPPSLPRSSPPSLSLLSPSLPSPPLLFARRPPALLSPSFYSPLTSVSPRFLRHAVFPSEPLPPLAPHHPPPHSPPPSWLIARSYD